MTLECAGSRSTLSYVRIIGASLSARRDLILTFADVGLTLISHENDYRLVKVLAVLAGL